MVVGLFNVCGTGLYITYNDFVDVLLVQLYLIFAFIVEFSVVKQVIVVVYQYILINTGSKYGEI